MQSEQQPKDFRKPNKKTIEDLEQQIKINRSFGFHRQEDLQI